MPPVPPKIISIIRQKGAEQYHSGADYKDCGQKPEKVSFNVAVDDSDGHSLANEQEISPNDDMNSEPYFPNICEQSLLDFENMREFDWVSWDWENNAEMGFNDLIMVFAHAVCKSCFYRKAETRSTLCEFVQHFR